MFPTALLGGLASAVPSIYKMFEGIRQRKEGKQGLDALVRPEYETPEEAKRMANIAQMRYADKFMPGQGMYMDKIEQQASNAFGQSSEAGNPFALITNIQAQSGNQFQEMQTKSMNQQMQNEQMYKQALMQMADYKDQEWQMNEFAPYKEKYTEYRDMFGAGTQNIYGGLDSLSAIGTGLIGNIGQGFGGGSGMGGSGGANGSGINQQAYNAALYKYQGSQDPVVSGIYNALFGATDANNNPR